MKKRIQKKKQPNTVSAKPSHSVPQEIIDKIKDKTEEYLKEEEDEMLSVNIRVHNILDIDKIYVTVSGNRVIDEPRSPNYYGNLLAEYLLSEMPEIELIGFDCYYEVELYFKVRS